MNKIKIAIVGDSISEGLGSKKYNYVKSLGNYLNQKNIEVDIRNFAVTGTTIKYAVENISQIKNYNPDCILVCYGNVEGIVRPNIYNSKVIKFLLPNRYEKIFMLDPRPFYSKNVLKAIPQHLENCYRFIMRRVVRLINGSFRFMEPKDFYDYYEYFVVEMMNITDKIFCVSPVRIDNRKFPGSSDSLAEFRQVVKTISKKYNIPYISLNEWQTDFSWSQIYGSDHFHPNLYGYELMGQFFGEQLIQCMGEITNNE